MAEKKIPYGVMVPLVTPFHDDESIDWEGYKKRASYFLDNNALNHIDSTFNKIVFYISADDLSNSSGELAYLNGLFESLYQNESLAPQNIF